MTPFLPPALIYLTAVKTKHRFCYSGKYANAWSLSSLLPLCLFHFGFVRAEPELEPLLLSVCVRSVCMSVTDHVDLCVGVPHVADNAAILHAVEVLSHHHVLIAWWRHYRQKLKR